MYISHFDYAIRSNVILGNENLHSVVPQRVVVASMGFIAWALTIALRTCLFIGITEMVVPLNQTSIRNEWAVCLVDSPAFMAGDLERK